MDIKDILYKWITAKPKMKFVIRVSKRGEKYVIEYAYYWLFIIYETVMIFKEFDTYQYVLNPSIGMVDLKFKTKESAESFSKQFVTIKDVEKFHLNEDKKLNSFRKKLKL